MRSQLACSPERSKMARNDIERLLLQCLAFGHYWMAIKKREHEKSPKILLGYAS